MAYLWENRLIKAGLKELGLWPIKSLKKKPINGRISLLLNSTMSAGLGKQKALSAANTINTRKMECMSVSPVARIYSAQAQNSSQELDGPAFMTLQRKEMWN